MRSTARAQAEHHAHTMPRGLCEMPRGAAWGTLKAAASQRRTVLGQGDPEHTKAQRSNFVCSYLFHALYLGPSTWKWDIFKGVQRQRNQSAQQCKIYIAC